MTHTATHRRMRRVVKAVCILNLLDLVATLFWVSTGVATEANPIMGSALDTNPVIFTLAKTTLVALGLAILWRFRTHPWAVRGIYGTCAVYTGLFLYHLWAIGVRLIPHFLHR